MRFLGRFKIDCRIKGVVYWEIFITACQLKAFIQVSQFNSWEYKK